MPGSRACRLGLVAMACSPVILAGSITNIEIASRYAPLCDPVGFIAIYGCLRGVCVRRAIRRTDLDCRAFGRECGRTALRPGTWTGGGIRSDQASTDHLGPATSAPEVTPCAC
ncbi:hypothetical protein JB92DRAFT_2914263 [Gautieria morchelliformis]|nr:hypothetical protein JB92DRAFT_2914263 [Gautieria morchelliformis]